MSLRQRPVSPPKKDSAVPQQGSVPPAQPKSTNPVWIVLGALGLSALLFLASNSFSLAALLTILLLMHCTQCILVDNGYILNTGTLEEVQLHWNIRVADVSHPELQIRYTPAGSIVVPGLSDAHAHLLEYGASRELALEGTKDIQGMFRAYGKYILANPEIQKNTSTYVLGGGWDHTVWPTTRWPTAADLDSDPVLRGRPIILQSKDCHALWVSGKVIEKSSPFPDVVEGGVIFRDESGHPNGMFLDNAQDIIFQPELTDADLMRRFSIAVRDVVAVGLTSVHDAGLNPMSLKFFAKQAELKKLPIRIYGMTFFDENGEYWGNKTKPIIDAGNGRLNARSVKIFADGALRTSGAALYEPYADDPTTTGAMRITSEVLHHWLPLFLRDGWQVDVFEASLKGINISASRPRLEHAQIITQADRIRLGKLGVIASIQPTHAISDMWYAQDRLGPERIKNLYAFSRLIHFLDFTLPLLGFLLDGKSPHGPGGWFPEERLSRQEALRGMTIDPAYASFTETTLGSLEPGKRADFVILSQDIMTIAADKVLATKVIATVIDGTPVYGQF
ncbi:putative amidohydrolase YtcJ [Mycena venus]|uniref:Putative amidohydrolase YtcJ n=1 Tax=Mycena venus TaxID=2733690 RepID=A0A8H6YN47_9AGAR|nr:putative amidohydrolase YtcJ [Mycena venus]